MGATSSARAACTVELDPSTLVVGWKAFKFVSKSGVDGRFTKVSVNGPTTGKSVEDILKKLELVIDTTSVETLNPVRNNTLKEKFFKVLKTAEIRAKVKGSKLVLQVNGVKREVDAKIEQDASSGKATLHSQIDVLKDFKADKAFESIHEACKVLHTGPDGVSKTWSEVELSAEAVFKSNCK